MTFPLTLPYPLGGPGPAYTPGPGDLVPVEDHCADGLSLLLSQWRSKATPFLDAMICSYLDRVQELEDAILDVHVDRWIDTGVGAQLDVIGRIVGESREDAAGDDILYRSRLKVRILINDSNGRVEELIAIADLYEGITAGGGSIWIQEGSMGITMILRDVLDFPIAPLIVRLRQAKAATVQLQVISLPALEAETFRTSSIHSGAPPVSADRGLGSIHAAPVTGGKLASIR